MAKVRYFVDHVDAAVSFYTQHLGFELKFKGLSGFPNAILGPFGVLRG